MKKSLLLAAAFLAVVAKPAMAGDGDKKTTLEIQGKGLANASFLLNKNVSDAGNIQDYAPGFCANYGLGVSLYFGNVGFGVEGLMGNTLGAYQGEFDILDTAGLAFSTQRYNSTVKLSVTEIPVFFKLKSEIGAYLEVGPQFTMINEAKYHYSTEGFKMDSVMSSSYATSYFSAVLGFGFKIPIAKTGLGILAGARLQYSLTDLQGVDALGQEFKNALIYDKPESTSAAKAGLMLGVVYTIGKKD